MTRGRYVAGCWGLLGRNSELAPLEKRLSGYSVPGDLLLAGLALGIRPRVWLGLDPALMSAPEGCVQARPGALELAGLLDYWDATQPFPRVVRSRANDSVSECARAWRLGISASRYPLGAACLLPPRWAGGRQRIRLAMRFALVLTGQRSGAYALAALATAELRRLLRLPTAFLRWGLASGLLGCRQEGNRRALDWAAAAELQVAWRALPRQHLQTLGIPASEWPRFGAEHLADCAALARAVEAGWALRGWKTAHEAVLNPPTAGGRHALAIRMGAIAPSCLGLAAGRSDEVLERALAAAEAGELDLPSLAPDDWESDARLDEAMDARGVLTHRQRAAQRVEAQREADEADPAERGRFVAGEHKRELRRALQARQRQGEPAYRLRVRSDVAARAEDRLAARSPETAVRRHSQEYARGQSLAPILRAVLADLLPRVAVGPIVVYGRDGEILADLLRRALPRRLRRRVRYVIASRALTTQARSRDTQYHAYIGRMVPSAGAVHADTGFGGSIPAWMRDERHIELGAVRLVTVDTQRAPEEWAIPIPREAIPSGRNLRDIVLEDLEYAPQRLESPFRWGQIRYASGGSAYWARLYGVCDALGLPRRVGGAPPQ